MSEGSLRTARIAADATLLCAIAVDVTLPLLVATRPEWWFDVLHVGVSPDRLHLALLDRAAAQWVMFAAVQIVALVRWRRWPSWLLLVAGARTSDWLTDLTYFACAPEPSPMRWTLLLPPLFNVGMTLILLAAWRRVRMPDERASA